MVQKLLHGGQVDYISVSGITSERNEKPPRLVPYFTLSGTIPHLPAYIVSRLSWLHYSRGLTTSRNHWKLSLQQSDKELGGQPK